MELLVFKKGMDHKMASALTDMGCLQLFLHSNEWGHRQQWMTLSLTQLQMKLQHEASSLCIYLLAI